MHTGPPRPAQPLRELDEVAYLRFASVEFVSIKTGRRLFAPGPPPEEPPPGHIRQRKEVPAMTVTPSQSQTDPQELSRGLLPLRTLVLLLLTGGIVVLSRTRPRVGNGARWRPNHARRARQARRAG